MEQQLFLDPSPVSSRVMTDDELQVENGGAVVIVAIIVTCGAKLGVATLVLAGTVACHIID